MPINMELEPMDGVENEGMSESEEDTEESADEDNTKDTVESINGENSRDDKQKNLKQKVYLPGQPLKDGEELVVDMSAYRMLHHAQSGAPCLSFDVIPDQLGNARENYPLTMYLVAGTQAAKAHVNNLLIMKMSNLYNVKSSDGSESDSSDDSDVEDEGRIPKMSVISIKHEGCVNRVRCTQIQDTTLVASWSELGRVNLWDLSEQVKAVENTELQPKHKNKQEMSDNTTKPLFIFKGHHSEGYALDWCPTELGTLASGDCKGNIHIWRLNSNSESPTWHVDQRPYNSHAPHSVEDLQWSPNERNVLCSCSVDKSIKIWDTRASPQSACMLTAAGAHTADINVISWNRKENQFLLSGGDDGMVCIWDLRQFTANGASPVAVFKQHTAPVTTVEWHPQETTVFASGGADDQIAQWDLSLEADQTGESEDNELSNLPSQLLFIHQGQTDIKELHWHPQCPGVMISTAHSGFNIFRTISV